MATAVAGKLTYEELEYVIEAQLRRAKDGHKDASGELRQWIALATNLGADDDETDSAVEDLRSMTPAQRATVRAELLRQAREAAEDARAVDAEHITTEDVPRS